MLKPSTAAVVALCLSAALLTGCNGDTPPGHSAGDSGITSSDGGGQRSLGDLPGVGVTNGGVTDTTLPRSPRVPRY